MSAGRRGEDAATAVEYALLIAAIAALIVLVVSVVGAQTREGLCGGSTAMEETGSANNPNC